jgi:inorganic pyrophosphatase
MGATRGQRDLSRLPLNTQDGTVRVVVETPAGSHSKYDYDPELDVFQLGDTLPRGTVFPFDFGFFPSTLAADGDPLDALILSDYGLAVGIIIEARLIGVIELETSGGRKTVRNDRLVVIPDSSVLYEEIETLADLPAKLLDQVEAFFALDSAFKGKQVHVLGRGGPEKAKKAVEAAQKTFGQETPDIRPR